MTAVPVEQACPSCGQTIKGDRRCVMWCQSYDWNLVPEEEGNRGLVQRLFDRLAARLATDLHRELVGPTATRPRWDLARIASYALAMVIHLLVLGLLVGGVALIVGTWPNQFTIALGLAMLGLAWLMRPRFGRLAGDAETLTLAEAPGLFTLLNKVAREVGTQPVDVVVITAAFNAAVTTVALRRRRVLVVGLPLWVALDPQERVAVLAHEFGHYAGGDTRHGLIVGAALNGLEELYHLARSSGPSHNQSPIIVWVSEMVAKMIMRVAAALVVAFYVALSWLTLRSSQRAEYLADQYAARVGSARAAAEGFDALITLSNSTMGSLHRSALRRETETMWTTLRPIWPAFLSPSGNGFGVWHG